MNSFHHMSFDKARADERLLTLDTMSDLVGKLLLRPNDTPEHFRTTYKMNGVYLILGIDKYQPEPEVVLTRLNRFSPYEEQDILKRANVTAPQNVSFPISEGGDSYDNIGRIFVKSSFLKQKQLMSDCDFGKISLIFSSERVRNAMLNPDIYPHMLVTLGAEGVPYSQIEAGLTLGNDFILESDGEDIFSTTRKDMWRSIFEKHLKSDVAKLNCPQYYDPKGPRPNMSYPWEQRHPFLEN